MQQPHSWMQYRYSYNNANDNYKMWIRDDQRIYETEDGTFVVADNSGWYEGVYNTFEEAKKVFDNDNTL